MSTEKIYSEHHKKERGAGFVLMGKERGEFLFGAIGTGKNILDLGCRDGSLSRYYHKENKVLGIDIDSDSLQRAHSAIGIETQQVDLNGDWPFGKEIYDVVVAAEFLEHIYYPEKVIQKVGEVLKTDGLFVGSIPNAFSLKNRVKYLLGIKTGTPLSDPTHINQFSRKEFLGLLKDNFKNAKVVPIGRFAALDKILPGLFAFIYMFVASDKK